MRPLKITTVGDGMVGKTCMLITYTQNEFPVEYVPTVFDNHACNITVDEKEYALTLWDTAGQEDYERLRPLSYPNVSANWLSLAVIISFIIRNLFFLLLLQTDCFLICYSISSKTSFDNVLSKWYPEIRHYAPHVPIVLVGKNFCNKILHFNRLFSTYRIPGTKSDLRVHGSEKFVTTAEGKKLKHKIKAYSLVECSAKKKLNLGEVFDEAVRAVEKKPHAKPRVCTIL